MAKGDMGIEDALRTCEGMANMLRPFSDAAEVLRAISTREKYSNELERAIDAQKKQLDVLKQELVDTGQDIESLRSTRDKEMQGINDDFNRKEAERHQEFAEKGEDLSNKLDRLKVRNDEVEANIKDSENTLAKLKVEKVDLLGEIGDLTRQKEGLKKQVARA